MLLLNTQSGGKCVVLRDVLVDKLSSYNELYSSIVVSGTSCMLLLNELIVVVAVTHRKINSFVDLSC